MKVIVKSSTMVTPNAMTPSGNMWITNLDLMATTNYHTRWIYFFPHNGAPNFFDSEVLKAALSRALVEFYPMAGRLTTDENGRIAINCNAQGALFVEAKCDEEIDDLGGFGPRPDLNLNPTADYSKGISSFPLSMIQVTRFKCGGVCLGIGNHHHVVDGSSGLHYINTWSDIARGLNLGIPPFFDRTVLRARNPPEPKFTHIEYDRGAPPQNPNTSEKTYSVFKLTLDQINALKAECSGDQDGDGTPPCYTTYEVVAGHVWRCATVARGLPEDQETKLYISTDGRSRLRPQLPPGYFGNVVFHATTVALSGEIRSNHVRFAARKMREAIGRMDNEYLRSAMDYLEVQADIRAIARGPSTYNSPNLGIISWLRLPYYDADFGWGKAVYLGLAAAPPEGKCHLLPSPAFDGGLLVSISLAKDHMQRFQKLLYGIII